MIFLLACSWLMNSDTNAMVSFAISTIIASLNDFGMCPVDILALNMLVIYSIMFGVTCCKICALILLPPGD